MANTFTINKINGNFSQTLMSGMIINGGQRLIADATGVKDPIYLMLDLSNSAIGATISFYSADGTVVKTVSFDSDGLATIPVTTYGLINDKGEIELELNGNGADFTSDMNVKLYAFSHIPVVNN